jgi:hypothetical protein
MLVSDFFISQGEIHYNKKHDQGEQKVYVW